MVLNKLVNIKKYILYPIILYISWRFGIALFQAFFEPYLKILPASDTLYERLFYSWTRYWDSGHYINIALNGYNYPSQNFFPLWPGLVRLISLTGIPIPMSGYILSLFIGQLNFILFYRLALYNLNQFEAKKALLIFCLYPGTMFLIPIYSENLFLAMTLLSFIYIEQGKILPAGIVGGLASATRLTGITLTIAFAFLNKPLTKKTLVILLSLSGFLCYSAYLYSTTGDAFYFVVAQKYFCSSFKNCSLTFPPLTLISDLLKESTIRSPSILNETLINCSITLFFSILLAKVYTQLKLPYFVFTLATILIPLSTGSTVSMTRYLLIAFPIFFVIPKVFKSKFSLVVICTIFLLLQIKFITFFTNDLWVALQNIHIM
jgi:hypothetical protein